MAQSLMIDVSNEFNKYFLTEVDRLNIQRLKPDNIDGMDFKERFKCEKIAGCLFVD